MSKLRGEGPSTPFSIAPQVLPWGPLMIVPVLGFPSLEESYLSLANQLCTGGQAGWSKGSRGSAPAREIHFVSLVAKGLEVSHSALAMGGVTVSETRQGGSQQPFGKCLSGMMSSFKPCVVGMAGALRCKHAPPSEPSQPGVSWLIFELHPSLVQTSDFCHDNVLLP